MIQWIWRNLKSWLGSKRPQLEPVWATAAVPRDSSVDSGPTKEVKKLDFAPAIRINYANDEMPLKEEISNAVKLQLVRFQARQKSFQEDRLNRFAQDHQRQLEQHIDRHAARVEARVASRLEQLCRELPATFTGSLEGLPQRIATTVHSLAEASTAALRKELSDGVAANVHRACLRPVIDQILALHDRIDDERQFLGVSFRRDADLATHIGARQLQAQHDAAAQSFGTEILMILRGMGVEPLDVSGPELDPHLQRVVDVELTSRAELDGRIARITRRGFRWNGALLRPEQVIVYKKGD